MITYAFWSKPLINKRFNHYNYELLMLFHAASNSYCKLLGLETHLITDDYGSNLFSFIDYDKVTIVPELNEQHNYLFTALPKFYALQKMQDDDILIDYDVLLLNRNVIDKIDKLDCDLIYGYYEGSKYINECINQKISLYKNTVNLLNNNDLQFKVPINQNKISYPNTCVMKFKNSDFKKEVIDTYFTAYYKLKALDFSNCLWPDIFLEQYFIKLISEKNNYKISPLIPNFQGNTEINIKYSNKIGFYHCGGNKANTLFVLKNKFKKDDKNRYNKFITAYNLLQNGSLLLE